MDFISNYTAQLGMDCQQACWDASLLIWWFPLADGIRSLRHSRWVAQGAWAGSMHSGNSSA